MQRKGPGRFFGKKKQSGKGKSSDKDDPNVHRQNFRIVAGPMVIVFSVLRFLAFQLWILLCAVISNAQALRSSATTSKACKQNQKERATENQKQQHTQKMPHTGFDHPATVKQKQHHRKAFECISKALKIDEEDKGNL